MPRSPDLWINATKSNLKKIESAQQSIIRPICFRKKIDSLLETLQRNKIRTIFEIFIVQNVKYRFRQLRQNG